ncbi:hypothetical protein J7J39_02510 [bacterium]|nr:hypothetical protein [bacterium]
MKLLIIDSNALLHRAFHALPPLTTKKGEPTGAVYGFLLTFFKALNDIKPDFVVATFDTPAPTFRHKQFKEYKAKRPKVPEELTVQIPKIKEVLRAFNIPIFEKEGFEADDLIATIVKKISEEKRYPGLETYILTGDFDTLQLVDKNTKVYTLGRGVKETVIYDREKVRERFKIKPSQIPDFKALAGDPSDNIPGVPGIGRKTATQLIEKFGSLENLYKEIEKEKDLKPKIKESLLQNKEQAFFSRILAKTREDVPIDFEIKECQFDRFDEEKVKSVLKRFEFYTLIKRLPEMQRKKEKISPGRDLRLL